MMVGVRNLMVLRIIIILKRSDTMADRELRTDERRGTMIQHSRQGTKGIITGVDVGGYFIYCKSNNCDKFIPYKDIRNYRVIR